MNTIGYILIIAAGLMLRSVMKGRAAHIGSDTIDAFTAFIRGDTKALKEVASRTGDSTIAPQSVPASGNTGASGFGGSIYQAALKLAKGAHYQWGGTGPTGYDCSGLMWRACQNAGVYTGSRFTTATIPLNNQFREVTDPQNDDLVVWIGRHMGVVIGKDQFYSARNYQSGIGVSSISGWGMGKPRYYRPVAVAGKNPAAGAGKGESGGGGGSW